jgi:hypothetical protein
VLLAHARAARADRAVRTALATAPTVEWAHELAAQSTRR